MFLKTLNKLPFAPVVGALFGLVAAILVVATPQFLFERGVVGSGLPQLISAAAPPLGEKARFATAVLAALAVGTGLWSLLRLFEARPAHRAAMARGGRIDPVIRPIGLELAHAPRPIFAESDLGAPFMSDEAIVIAREELLLDPAMMAAGQGVEAPLATVPATTRFRSATVASMLGELEDAVARRAALVGAVPVQPGDMASMRATLGVPLAA